MYYYVFNADELRHSVIYLSQIRSDNLLVYLSLNSSLILLLYIYQISSGNMLKYLLKISSVIWIIYNMYLSQICSGNLSAFIAVVMVKEEYSATMKGRCLLHCWECQRRYVGHGQDCLGREDFYLK